MLDSVTDLASLLKDPSLLVTKAYVAGQWVDADDGSTFTVTNPARGDVICSLPNLGRTETARAIKAAHAAHRDWATWTGKERAQTLRRWFDLCMANQDDLATILTAEMGKPLAEAKGEIAYGSAYIEFYGEEAKRSSDLSQTTHYLFSFQASLTISCVKASNSVLARRT